MSAKIVFKGGPAMKKNIEMLAAKFGTRVAAALYLEAELIMTKAKQEFIPVDHGALRDSGHTLPPVIRGQDVSVKMEFGDNAAPYALAVHEHPGPNDPPSWRNKGTSSSSKSKNKVRTPGVVTFHPSGRGPKYLTKPMQTALRGMKGRIQARVMANNTGV